MKKLTDKARRCGYVFCEGHLTEKCLICNNPACGTCGRCWYCSGDHYKHGGWRGKKLTERGRQRYMYARQALRMSISEFQAATRSVQRATQTLRRVCPHKNVSFVTWAGDGKDVPFCECRECGKVVWRISSNVRTKKGS